MNSTQKFLPGICSVTLNKLSADEVLKHLAATDLRGIEWWGGEHVPPGNTETAMRVGEATRAQGMTVTSYGSYYRCCVSESDLFDAVLGSAKAVGAPTIRVWAGGCNREDADAAKVRAVQEDAVRVAELAAEQGISITFEFHTGSLTNGNANAARLMGELEQPNIFFSWQPPHGFTKEHCQSGLEALLPRLSTIHAYHWTIGSYERDLYDEERRSLKWPDDYNRHPLADGIDRWRGFLQTAAVSERRHPVLLEFARNDSHKQVLEDAKTLVDLIGEFNSGEGGV